MTIRLGIVGAGTMGAIHAGIFALDHRTRITAVFDSNTERAQTLAQTHHTKATESVEQLLDLVDAVVVTTPNTRHAGVTAAALGRDLHVFCEKPVATDLRSAQAVVQATRASKGKLQIGFNKRFAPVYTFVKQMIESGELRPFSAHARFNRGELQNPPWVIDASITGGFLYETPVHHFDMFPWLMGPVASVRCVATSNRYAELDDFSMLIGFESGLHATFHSCAHASWFFPYERMEIFGEHATVETQEMTKVTFSRLGQEMIVRDFTAMSRDDKKGYTGEDRHFIDCITTGQTPSVGAIDGYRVTELIEACYESAREKAEVAVKSKT